MPARCYVIAPAQVKTLRRIPFPFEGLSSRKDGMPAARPHRVCITYAKAHIRVRQHCHHGAMSIYVTHTTALWANVLMGMSGIPRRRKLATWPSSRSGESQLACPDVAGKAAFRAVSRKFAAMGLPDFPGPMDVLAPASGDRHATISVRPHQWSQPVPAGSFIDLGEGVLLASPELCYLQLADRLANVELMLLGFALCGGYFPARCQKGFVCLDPLTSTTKLGRYLDASPKGTRGIAKARNALRKVLDGSLSPMESSCAILLTLDRRLGGYGVQAPVLNARIELGTDASRTSRLSYCMIDLYWPQARFGIEYDGAPFHTDDARDIRRELVLANLGVSTRRLTAEQLLDQRQFRLVVREASMALGRRLRPPPTGIADRRDMLLEGLFPTERDKRPATAHEAASKQKGPIVTTEFAKPSWTLPERLASEALH